LTPIARRRAGSRSPKAAPAAWSAPRSPKFPVPPRYVTYSNAAKISELHVSLDVVETFGAVSVATAWAMARGALAASEADVAVAITGIAGPGGGSPAKPVGTVVFALAERNADPAKIVADQRLFENENRAGVRLQAALCALELLMP
jgi:nicotinamide-nucleotide amidase